nr:hypothetical protein [Akkermansiaceae bacterium]
KELNAKDNSLELELKAGNPAAHELKNLRVEVRLDYHGQALLVESEPFSMTIKEKNETAS